MDIQELFTSILVLWIVAIGFAVIFRGPRGGLATFWWPIRASLRLLCRMVGNTLIFIGQSIRW